MPQGQIGGTGLTPKSPEGDFILKQDSLPAGRQGLRNSTAIITEITEYMRNTARTQRRKRGFAPTCSRCISLSLEFSL
jgi:hypothetical protein